MTTTELIKKLQELDPDGNQEVLVGVYSAPNSIESVRVETVYTVNNYNNKAIYFWDDSYKTSKPKDMIIINPEEME